MNKQTTALALLVSHLATSPQLGQQLETLHGLALYQSGDALLGAEEKEALFNAKLLAERLNALKREDLAPLYALL